MKISKSKANLTTNDDSAESLAFGIGDASVIIDILRSKLYSHPLRTMIQEYICNARDASREAGNGEGIEITCPTKLDPVFRVRDFGVGLSPQRVREVFVLYGASTKREDNDQTGGFGIGAKSAWAYTDSFTVVSYYQGKKYTYIAHLGKNSEGTLDLLDEESTKEPNGVEIAVGIQEQDIFSAVESIFRATLFWNPRPTLKGIVDVEVPNYYRNLPEFEGPDFFLGSLIIPCFRTVDVKTKSEMAMLSKDQKSASFNVYAVIDGIVYEITKAIGEEKRKLFSKTSQLYLLFKVGELTINANREEIIFDETNSKVIDTKLDSVFSYLSNYREDRLKTCTNLKELKALTTKESLSFSSLDSDFETSIAMGSFQVQVRKKREDFYFDVVGEKIYDVSLQNRIREWRFVDVKAILTLDEDTAYNWEDFLNTTRFLDRFPAFQNMWVVKGTLPEIYRPFMLKEESKKKLMELYQNYLKTKAKKEQDQKFEDLKVREQRRRLEEFAVKWGLEASAEAQGRAISVSLEKIQELPKKDTWVYLLMPQGIPGFIDGKNDISRKILYVNKKLKRRVLLTDKERVEATKALGLTHMEEWLDSEKFKLGSVEKQKILEHLRMTLLPSFIKNFSLEFIEAMKPYSKPEDYEIMRSLKILSLNAPSVKLEELRLFFEEEILELEALVKEEKKQLEEWTQKYSFFKIVDFGVKAWEQECLKLLELMQKSQKVEESTEKNKDVFKGLASFMGLGKKIEGEED